MTTTYGTASFGPPATPANFNGDVVVANDGVGSSTDGCEALTNFAAVAGNLVIIDRGTCTFVVKAKNAQNAGATRHDHRQQRRRPIRRSGLGGVDPSITIPALSVTLADGTAIKGASGVQVGFVVDPRTLQGADDAGHPRLYMPDPVQPGSSGSHYDTAMAPNALMEPAINDSLNAALNLDITANLLKDTGWVLNGGNATHRWMRYRHRRRQRCRHHHRRQRPSHKQPVHETMRPATTRAAWKPTSRGWSRSHLITDEQGKKLMACAVHRVTKPQGGVRNRRFGAGFLSWAGPIRLSWPAGVGDRAPGWPDFGAPLYFAPPGG